MCLLDFIKTYQYHGEDHQIQLWVSQCVHNLFGLECPALDAGPVYAHMFQQRNLFCIIKPSCLHRRVWYEQERRQSNHNSQTSESDEHDTPSSKPSSRCHVLEAIGDGTTNDLSEPKTTIPEGEARRLFGLGVPLRADKK